MIDYETYCRIKHLQQEGLTLTQIARTLSLDPRTVRTWLETNRFRRRQSPRRPSKLDPHKPLVKRLVETHPFTAVQIHQRLREAGYTGGLTILKQYLYTIRPPRRPAFLTLAFAPGECAQVDWGHYGTVNVGRGRRRLSFFVMVLCYSRLMYVELTVSQTMEHFLGCHLNAFEYFGGLVPEKIMVDNLKSAVIRRLTGEAPVFNRRYLDFADTLGFKIVPCNVGAGHEKGRVESGVGYVKKNFLAGLEIPSFAALAPAARHWLDTVANVRVHGETRERPVDRFETERSHLRPLPPHELDIASVHSVRASNRFRVTFQSNRYSVPAEYASQRLTLKAYPDRICLYTARSDRAPGQYDDEKLIARHRRSYDQHGDFEDPDHPKALLEQRRSARAQRQLARFLALAPIAESYYAELAARRFNPRHHVNKIVTLSEIYGTDAVARALEDARHFQAFSSEYIANLLEARARALPEPSPLHLTRRSDLLELELPEPDLSLYDDNDNNDGTGEPA
jgi:transposase